MKLKKNTIVKAMSYFNFVVFLVMNQLIVHQAKLARRKIKAGEGNGKESRPQQEWKKKAIRCNEMCKCQDDYRFKCNWHHLHTGDHMLR